MNRVLCWLGVMAFTAVQAGASVNYSIEVDSALANPVAPARHAQLTVSLSTPSYFVNDATAVSVVIPLPPGSTDIVAEGAGWSCAVSGTTALCAIHLPASSFGQTPDPITVSFNAPPSRDGLRYTSLATLDTSVPNESSRGNSDTISVTVYRSFAVTTPDDSGSGSLREAIAAANERCPMDAIPCRIAFAQPMTIRPLSPLPAITACALLIDGGIPGGSLPGVARPVEISGANVSYGNGLEVQSCDVRILGLSVNSFPENGIALKPSPPAARFGYQYITISDCFIGTDATATEARANGLRGVSIESPLVNATLVSDTIAGNTRSGVFVWAADNLQIKGCRIGVGRDDQPLGNGASGVYVDGGEVRIDSATIVAHNSDFGVGVGPHAISVSAEPEHFFANGIRDYDWGIDGATLTDPSGRMPPVPVILDAVYDPAQNATTISGVLSSEGIGSPAYYSVQLFQPTEAGNTLLATASVTKSSSGEWIFVAVVDEDWGGEKPGDVRGLPVVGQTTYTQFLDVPMPIIDTSELGVAVTVH